jgi:polysaccharide export outer membrane protein
LLLSIAFFVAILASSPCRGESAQAEESGDPVPIVTGRTIPLNPGFHPTDSEYRIGIEDILAISVWRDPDLSRELPVRPDGKISLPLIGDVVAAGKPPRALGEEIETRLRDYLTSPSVTVIVKEVNSLKVYLLGEVVEPGPIMLRSTLRLLQAISMAGGVTEFGGRGGVLIYRQTPLREEVLQISYRDLLKGENPGDNIVLQPNDTIVVR